MAIVGNKKTMSKRSQLRKTYYKLIGYYKDNNGKNFQNDYVIWLEDNIIKLLDRKDHENTNSPNTHFKQL